MDKGLLAVVTILMVIFAAALGYALYVVSQPAEVLVENVGTTNENTNVDQTNQLIQNLQRQIDAEIKANEEALKLYENQIKDLESRYKEELEKTKTDLENQKNNLDSTSSNTNNVKNSAKFFSDEYLVNYNLRSCSADLSRVEDFIDSDYDDYEKDFKKESRSTETNIKAVKDKITAVRALLNKTTTTYTLNEGTTLAQFTIEFNNIDTMLENLEDDIDDIANEMDVDELKVLGSWEKLYKKINEDTQNEISDAQDDYRDAEDDLSETSVNYRGLDDSLNDVIEDLKDSEEDINDVEKDFDDLEREAKNFRTQLKSVCGN